MPQFLRDTFDLIYAPVLIPLIRIAWILIIGLLVLKVIDSGLKRLRLLIPASDILSVARVEQRTKTLRHIIRGVSRGILVVILALTVSSELGFDIAPILASAGILGLAVSFGAQSLVKDVISGFFILFENQFAIGDVIEIAGKSGVVEKMTLRVAVLRDGAGVMHVVPNSEIKVVSNKTRGWSRAVVDVGIGYDEDIDRALGIIRDEAAQLATDRVWSLQLDGAPEVVGVESLGDSSVVIRTLIRTQPGSQWTVAREFRRRIKNRFDRDGVEIPFPQRKV